MSRSCASAQLHEELADGARRGLEVRQTDLIVLGEMPLTRRATRSGWCNWRTVQPSSRCSPTGSRRLTCARERRRGRLLRGRDDSTGFCAPRAARCSTAPDGVARLDTLGRLTATAIDEPVVDGANGPDGAYFVTAERILGLSSAMNAVVRSDRADVTSVGGIGSNMLLGHAAGVDVADAALGSRVAGARGSLPPVAALSRGSALRRGGLLATWEDGERRAARGAKRRAGRGRALRVAADARRSGEDREPARRRGRQRPTPCSRPRTQRRPIRDAVRLLGMCIRLFPDANRGVLDALDAHDPIHPIARTRPVHGQRGRE